MASTVVSLTFTFRTLLGNEQSVQVSDTTKAP